MPSTNFTVNFFGYISLIVANKLFSRILFKNYGSRSKKGEIPRFELSHNALNRKPQK